MGYVSDYRLHENSLWPESAEPSLQQPAGVLMTSL